MAKGLLTHLRNQKEQRTKFFETGNKVTGVSDIFDNRRGKMFRPRENQFEVRLNKLLDAAEEMHKGSPPADMVEKRKEYARKGKEEIAKLITILFPNTYDRTKAVGIAKSKVFKGEVANGTYYFIDPENAAWVGREVRIQLHLKEMAKKLILAIPERLDREGKKDLRQRIVDVLTERKQVAELIAFADEQIISFTTSRVAELVESLENEKRYTEARKLLEFSEEPFEVRRIIAEKKAAVKVETVKTKSEVKTEVSAPETPMLVPEVPTTSVVPIVPIVEVQAATPKRRRKTEK